MRARAVSLDRKGMGRRLFLVASAAALLFTSACVRTRTPSIPVASKAPAFSLRDSEGKRVSLADLTARGPGIVVFYRGYW